MSLPNTSKDFIKDLEVEFFKFIWNNSPDRIKRANACKTVKNGGLGIINIEEFIDNLKITWLRKFLKSDYLT